MDTETQFDFRCSKCYTSHRKRGKKKKETERWKRDFTRFAEETLSFLLDHENLTDYNKGGGGCCGKASKSQQTENESFAKSKRSLQNRVDSGRDREDRETYLDDPSR